MVFSLSAPPHLVVTELLKQHPSPFRIYISARFWAQFKLERLALDHDQRHGSLFSYPLQKYPSLRKLYPKCLASEVFWIFWTWEYLHTCNEISWGWKSKKKKKNTKSCHFDIFPPSLF